jgi:putative ABC transport system permease protein
MTELLIVAIVGLIIGAAIGSCLSVPVSNKLLDNEIANASSKYEDIGKNFGKSGFNPGNMPGMPGSSSSKSSSSNSGEGTSTESSSSEGSTESTNEKKSNVPNFGNFGVAQVNQVESIDAVVDFKVLAELLGIGVLLTLLSSLASMIAIARFSPLKILKERG